MKRGYCGIVLHDCAKAVNVANTLRAAGCFGAKFIHLSGKTPTTPHEKLAVDTAGIWKQVPVYRVEDPFTNTPDNVCIIAVELAPNARSLVNFAHPERAMYVFGPENGSLPPEILVRCDAVVQIPAHICLNLAAAVNVVLYDRTAKRGL